MNLTWKRSTGLLLLLLTVAGCRSAKDDPTGIILVGSPEISTRERLVNDRLIQDGWLRKKLEASDGVSFDDFQGLLDERTMTALSVNASINANTNDLAIHNAESAKKLQSLEESSEMSALDHEIKRLEKQNRIAKLRQEQSATTSDSTEEAEEDGAADDAADDNSTQTVSRPSSPASDLAGDLLTRLASSQRASLPDPSAIAATKAKSSPIEALRDRLAYREEIRNEILENQLDDRHDLAGNTLYRLNLDSTLIPSAGNSAWAVIDVQVEPSEGGGGDLYREWQRSFQRRFENEINSQLVRMLWCLGDLSASAPSTTKCGVGTAEIEELLSFSNETAAFYAGAPAGSPIAERSYDQQVKVNMRNMLRVMAGSDEFAQRRELELLIARKVKSDYFDSHQLRFYLPEPSIGRACANNATTRSTRIVNWCSASPDFGLPVVDSPYYECVEDARGRRDPRENRMVRFDCALSDASHSYAYSATPKDSVQRISRVAASRNTLELAAAISALTGAASIDAATAFIRDNQRLMHSILREPLVVGYTEGSYENPENKGTAHFGWLIGPRFGLSQKPFRRETVNMDHRPIQNSLAAAISLPGWVKHAKVTVKTCWKPKQSVQGNSDNPCASTVERMHFVELPGRMDAIHNLLVNRVEPMPLGWENYEVVSGLPAALLIKGSNLWRSTEVTLGAQTADEIRVLPDMTGIIARFEKVKETASLDGVKPRTVDVNIWTSGGNQAVGEARIYPQKKGDVEWKIAWRQPRLVKDEEIAVQMLDGALPTSFAKLDLVVEGFDTSNAKWTEPIRLNSIARDKIVSAKLSPVTGLANGMEVRGSIWTLLRPDSVAVDIKATADGTAIYYESSNDAKVRTSANIKPGGKLTLTFPKRVAQAYPGFQKPNVSVTATPAALSAAPSSQTWKTVDGQEVFECTVTITGTIDPATSPKLKLTVEPLAEGLILDKVDIPIVQ